MHSSVFVVGTMGDGTVKTVPYKYGCNHHPRDQRSEIPKHTRRDQRSEIPIPPQEAWGNNIVPHDTPLPIRFVGVLGGTFSKVPPSRCICACGLGRFFLVG